MSDWTFAQSDPAEELAKLHFFSVKKRQPEGDIEFIITIQSNPSPPPGHRRSGRCW
jgi:hypothetical protein